MNRPLVLLIFFFIMIIAAVCIWLVFPQMRDNPCSLIVMVITAIAGIFAIIHYIEEIIRVLVEIKEDIEKVNKKFYDWLSRNRKKLLQVLPIIVITAVLIMVIVKFCGDTKLCMIPPPTVVHTNSSPTMMINLSTDDQPSVTQPIIMPSVPTMKTTPMPLPTWIKYEIPGCHLDITLVSTPSLTEFGTLPEVNELNYELQETSYCGIVVEFVKNPFDASHYHAISLFTRGQDGGEKFLIKIKDKSNHEFQSEQTAAKTWQKLVIPFENFGGNDLTNPKFFGLPQIENISLNFRYEQGNNGVIYVAAFQFE